MHTFTFEDRQKLVVTDEVKHTDLAAELPHANE